MQAWGTQWPYWLIGLGCFLRVTVGLAIIGIWMEGRLAALAWELHCKLKNYHKETAVPVTGSKPHGFLRCCSPRPLSMYPL